MHIYDYLWVYMRQCFHCSFVCPIGLEWVDLGSPHRETFGTIAVHDHNSGGDALSTLDVDSLNWENYEEEEDTFEEPFTACESFEQIFEVTCCFVFLRDARIVLAKSYDLSRPYPFNLPIRNWTFRIRICSKSMHS